MTYKEKKELNALRSVVVLDPDLNVYRASYPEIDPDIPCSDNQWQAVAMSRSMEKQLIKSKLLPVYNHKFQDLLIRGCIELVSPSKISQWKAKGGKLSYISHHPVLTPDKATTKVRIVINLSLKNSGTNLSPNDNWPKGPNALKSMYQVFYASDYIQLPSTST